MFDHLRAGAVTSPFALVAADTACPFAARARWRELHADGAWAAQVAQVGEHLAARMGDYAREQVDMIVVTIADPQVGASVNNLAAAVTALLRLLDPKAGSGDWEQELLEPGWRLWIAGVPVFPLAFAPFYSRDHPRFSASGATHLVLQLEDSFGQHGISSSLRARQRLSAFVRACFEQRGVAYLPEITAHPAKSLRLIKPAADGDPPVRWWEHGAEARGP